MAKFVNLTPHALQIRANGTDLTIEPSGSVARVSTTTTVVGAVDGIEVVKTTMGQVEGLPAPEADTIYLVSGMVGAAISGRTDVFGPDTGSTAVRNDKGHIVAVTRLVKFG